MYCMDDDKVLKLLVPTAQADDPITMNRVGDAASSASLDGMIEALTLVDIAKNIHYQVILALRVVIQTTKGQDWERARALPLLHMMSVLDITQNKKHIEKALRICCEAMLDKSGQYRAMAHLDNDALHLAIDCLLEHIGARQSTLVHEKQPWRFFLARIGIMAPNSSLSTSQRRAKLEFMDRATEPLHDYLKYLFHEIDIERSKPEPDLERIIEMENEADLLQNLRHRSFRLWRHG